MTSHHNKAKKPDQRRITEEDIQVHNYAKLSHCSNNKNFFPLYYTLVADKEGNMAAEKCRSALDLGSLDH